MLTYLLLSLGLLAPHPNSLSSSRVEVSEAEVRVTLRCQVLSAWEVLPTLDDDGDGEVRQEEVERRGEPLLAYVSEHYRLSANPAEGGSGGTRLELSGEGLRYIPRSSGDPLAELGGAIELSLRAPLTGSLESLGLEVDLFRESGESHIDLSTVVWPDGKTETFTLTLESPRARSTPRGGGAFGVFLRLGFEHILGGWDHLAFLLALLLSSRRLRSVLGWVTAFTLAHSLSLALATLGLVDVGGWERLVESAIALSIAYVAADNLLRPDLVRGRWVEAFGFGLLHGLGFAGFLAESLVLESAKTVALFAFNVGVELGQLAVVAALVAPFLLWNRRRSEAPEFLLPRPLRRFGSAAVVVLGLYWFLERL